MTRAVEIEEDDRFLPVGVVARILGCTSRHVLELINAKAIEAVDLRCPGASRARWLVRRGSIYTFRKDRWNVKPTNSE